jgi:hypothetical protein
MTAENTSGRWVLDPSIFDVGFGETFTGKEENLFGPLGAITESGEYFSLNLGFNHLEGKNSVVVLDTNKKTLTYRTYRPVYIPDGKVKNWKLDLKLLEDPQSELFNSELLFPHMNYFLNLMRRVVIPEMEEKKGKEVTEVLKEACKPLVEYFQKQQEIASLWLEPLRKIS